MRRFAACRLLLVSYKPLARETAMSAVGDLDLFNTRYAGGNLAKHVGRRTAKKINRGRGKQGRKKKPEAHQDNTPADVRVVILVLPNISGELCDMSIIDACSGGGGTRVEEQYHSYLCRVDGAI